MGPIVGAVVGVVAGFTILVAVFLLLRRRRASAGPSNIDIGSYYGLPPRTPTGSSVEPYQPGHTNEVSLLGPAVSSPGLLPVSAPPLSSPSSEISMASPHPTSESKSPPVILTWDPSDAARSRDSEVEKRLRQLEALARPPDIVHYFLNLAMSSDPTLPPELELQIFELAAQLHPNEIPKFLRVARRVLHWYVYAYAILLFTLGFMSTISRNRLEPILYNVVTVGPGRTLPAIIAVSKSKPDNFLHESVRHVLLVPMDVWQLARSEYKTVSAVLSLFTGMEDFTALGDVKPINMLEIFATVRLRRLGMDLRKIMGGPINLTLPCFSSLTHLDVFDEICAEHVGAWADLAVLPRLTHLCLHDVVPANIWRMVGRTCPGIQLLSFVGDYADQWEEGARGGEDFWTRGARFVAQKRKGEIPGTLPVVCRTSLANGLICYHDLLVSSIFILPSPPARNTTVTFINASLDAT
ncbi:hypothetical protein C8R44DRAFT_865540 [Mycena epipterygia]|nr:hypothetical protein C8R44DRAFT_865540 [Mycena epipterygia]